MNYLKFRIIGLAAVMGLALGMVSCQDDVNAPSPDKVFEASIKPNSTILEVKKAYWDDATNYIDTIGVREDGQHYIISGRVVSCDENGNIFKSLVIQDETAALAFSINSYNLYLKYRVGQEVVVDLTGMYIGKYNGLQQMGYPEWYEGGSAWEATFMSPELFYQHAQLNGWPKPELVDTVQVNSFLELGTTPDELCYWQSRIVKFNNVAFQEGGKAEFSEYHSSGVNRVITDAQGNSLNVRTSGYSTFWNKTLPEGRGDVVAILSYYGTSGWQLLLNDYEGCMNFGNPTVAPGAEDNPYTVSEVVALEEAGKAASGWVTGYIVGTVAPELETVTSNDDIEWSAEPTLANTLVIGPTPETKNYKECLVILLKSGSDLRKYGALRENPSNYGKQIWLKGNFTISEETYGTYGITGNNGTVAEFKIDGVEIGGGVGKEGDGTEANPYNCKQVIAMGPTSTTEAVASGVWVKGFIVGYYENYEAHFQASTSQRANILISDNPSADAAAQCVCVQLVSNTDTRNALNLVDNPGVLGKVVSVKGDVMKYNTLPGIKNTSAYALDGEGGGEGGGETPATGSTLFEETFKSSMGLFTIHNVTVPEAASYIWNFDSSYGYMKASAYINGASYASDSWVVSPLLDLSKATKAELTFDHCTNKFPSLDVAKRQCTLAVSVDGGDWQTVAIPTYSDNASWTFVNSGSINLSAYVGKKILVGFHYTSEDGASGTWEMKNFKIEGTGEITASANSTFPGGGSTTPGGGETPGGGDDPQTPPTGQYKGDFDTFNSSTPTSKYGTYTNATGWTATNANILAGLEEGATDGNPRFAFIGTPTTLAACINGKVGSEGKITSPTLKGGCNKLTFSYGFAYAETKAKFTVNVLQNGAVVKSETVTLDQIQQKHAYEFSMNVGVTGDFSIEIVNDAYTQSTSNKDRVAIWHLTWD